MPRSNSRQRPLPSRQELKEWRNLESGGGRHELPDVEIPARNGELYFFDDADQPGSAYETRSVASLSA